MIGSFLEEQFTLAELAERLGVHPRTIRSYIEKGLLRGPEGAGRGARYTSYHLQRLRAIWVLKDLRGLPMPEVRRRLLAMTPADFGSVAQESDRGSVLSAAPQPPNSALAYLRGVASGADVELSPAPMDVLLTRLHRLSPRGSPARKARGEVWTTIPLTPDVEIRVRGALTGDELARWERIADHLREFLLGEPGEE